MIPALSDLLALANPSISDKFFSMGIWTYLLLFCVFFFSATVVGGLVPDNMLLLLSGAAVLDNGLSPLSLILAAAGGGFLGYQINYWSGRLLDLSFCRKGCFFVLDDTNMQKAADLMKRFGPVALLMSRFLPVLNLPGFIAGLESMNSRTYVVYNLAGTALWCGLLLFLGYYIGSIPLINDYLDFITDIVLVITAGAIVVLIILHARNYLKSRNDRSPA